MRKMLMAAVAATAFALAGARTVQAADGGYLGIYLVDDSNGTRGAYVEDVAPESPAEKAGVRRGDYVTAINGDSTANAHSLIEHLVKAGAGEQVTLHLRRDDWERDLKITLGKRDITPEKKPEAPATTEAGERGFLGVYLKANPEGAGAFVDGVEPESPAAKAALKKGDLIVGVNGTDVKDDAQLRDLLRGSKPGTKLALRVSRDGWTHDVNVELGRRPGERTAPPPAAKPAEPTPPPSPAAKKPAFMGVSLVDNDGKGPLKVDDVMANSPAEKAGLKPGDTVTAIGDKKVTTIKDFEDAMRAHFAGEELMVSIEREGGWTRQIKVMLGEKTTKD